MALPTPKNGFNLRIPRKLGVALLIATLSAMAGGAGTLLFTKLTQPSTQDTLRDAQLTSLQVQLAELERDLVELNDDDLAITYRERVDTLVAQVARIRSQLDGVLGREDRRQEDRGD